jgi:hypothetical protein
MSYKELYAFCQTLSPKISRRDIRKKSLELTSVPRIRHVRTTMDTAISRGYFLRPQNSAHPIVSAIGNHAIVTARDLNYCWERFVYVKELMHLFSLAAQATDTGDKFESLLNEFAGPSTVASPQMEAELVAFWMALGVMCPESKRIEYEKQRAASEIDDYSIALDLRIPQQYVPRLFDRRYSSIIKKLTSE